MREDPAGRPAVPRKCRVTDAHGGPNHPSGVAAPTTPSARGAEEEWSSAPVRGLKDLELRRSGETQPETANQSPAPPAASGEHPGFRELASDALRYWEPRRLLYNLALLVVVLVHFITAWPGSRTLVTRDSLLGLFFLAVLANVAYCAAYAVDLFVQFSGQRTAWTRWRWAVFAIGTAFAAVITHFMTAGIVAAPHGG